MSGIAARLAQKLLKEIDEGTLKTLSSAISKGSPKRFTAEEAAAVNKYLPSMSRKERTDILKEIEKARAPKEKPNFTLVKQKKEKPRRREVAKQMKGQKEVAQEIREKVLSRPPLMPLGQTSPVFQAPPPALRGSTAIEPQVEMGPIGAREKRLKQIAGSAPRSPSPSAPLELPPAREFIQKRDSRGRLLTPKQAAAGVAGVAVGGATGAALLSEKEKPSIVEQINEEVEPEIIEPSMEARILGDEKPVKLSGVEKKVYGALTGKEPAAAERPTASDIKVGVEAAASPAAVETIPDKEDRDWYVERMNQLSSARQQAYDAYAAGLAKAETEKERRDTAIAFGKILETLAHGLIKIGAANYGLKKGIDMSGMKFDKENWDESFKLSQQSYEGRMASLKGLLTEKEKSLRGLEEEAGTLRRQQEEQEALDQRAQAKLLLDEQQAIQKEKWNRERLASQQRHEIYMQTLKNAARGDEDAKRLADRQFKQNLRGLETDIDDLEFQLKSMEKARNLLDKNDIDEALLRLQGAGLDLSSFEQAKEDKPWYQVFTSEKDLLKEYLTKQSNEANKNLQEQKNLRRKLLFAEDKYLEEPNQAQAPEAQPPKESLPEKPVGGRVILNSASELPDIGD